ncbi:MAG TPA: hypothetical protein VL101_17775 [Nordella sp.]|nr:hypothetical protein [Nordella sp.]
MRGLPKAVIHRPWDRASDVKSYPARIVDHAVARERALLALNRLD